MEMVGIMPQLILNVGNLRIELVVLSRAGGNHGLNIVVVVGFHDGYYIVGGGVRTRRKKERSLVVSGMRAAAVILYRTSGFPLCGLGCAFISCA